MSLFIPLLLVGALVSTSAPNVTHNDKAPRTPRAVLDTIAHRQIATNLIVHARHDAEAGQIDAARAQMLTANTMLRESGGITKESVYSLVHIDFALQRYSEAGDLLNEFADQSMKRGNVAEAANAVADAAELYNMGNQRVQLSDAVARLRIMLTDPRMDDSDRAVLKKRLG